MTHVRYFGCFTFQKARLPNYYRTEGRSVLIWGNRGPEPRASHVLAVISPLRPSPPPLISFPCQNNFQSLIMLKAGQNSETKTRDLELSGLSAEARDELGRLLGRDQLGPMYCELE